MYYQEIYSCLAYNNIVSVSNTYGTFDYEYINPTWRQINNWHGISETTYDDTMELVFKNEQVWLGITSNDNNNNYKIKMFTDNDHEGENLAVTVTYPYEPVCAFQNGAQDGEVYMHCIENKQIVQYILYPQQEIKFPFLDNTATGTYEFKGIVEFCLQASSFDVFCSKVDDIVATSIDINTYQIWENRPNLFGVLYDTPEQYNSTAASIIYADGSQKLEVLIPCSNYFSGHDLEFSLNNLSPKEEGVSVFYQVYQKYTEYTNELDKTVNDYKLLDLDSFRNANNQLYLVLTDGKSNTFEIYKENDNVEGQINLIKSIDSQMTNKKAVVLYPSEELRILVVEGIDTQGQIQWKAYNITQPENTVTELQVQWLEDKISDYTSALGRFENYENQTVIDQVKDQIVLFNFEVKDNQIQFQSMKNIDSEIVKDAQFTTFDITYDDLLLAYDQNSGIVYTFDLTKMDNWVADITFQAAQQGKPIEFAAMQTQQREFEDYYAKQYVVANIDGLLQQWTVNTEGQISVYQNFMRNTGDTCTYSNSIDAKDYFAAVVVSCENKESYIRIFALQQEAFSNIYTDIPVNNQNSKLLFDVYNEEKNQLYLFVFNNNLTTFNLRSEKDEPVSSNLIPEPHYDPSVIWGKVSIVYDNIDVGRFIEAQTLNFEIIAKQKESDQTQKTQVKVEVEAVGSTEIQVNDEVAQDVDILSKPELTYDDEQIVDSQVPHDSILGYNVQLNIYVSELNQLYTPQYNCDIINWQSDLVCITSKEHLIYSETNQSSFSQKSYYSLAKYTDQTVAILVDEGVKICEVYYDYDHPCDWFEYDLDQKCYLMDVEQVTRNKVVQKDPLIALVCEIEGKIQVKVQIQDYNKEIISLTWESYDKPTFLRMFQQQQENLYYVVTISELVDSDQLNSIHITQVELLLDDQSRVNDIVFNYKQLLNYGNLDTEELLVRDVEFIQKTDAFVLADESGYIHFIEKDNTGQFVLEAKWEVPQIQFQTSEIQNNPIDIEMIEDKKMIVTMKWGDIYFLVFDPHNLIQEPQWIYYSQMKNDPNNPTQEFYSHSGTISLDKKLYAIILIDHSNGNEKLRVYDLNPKEDTSEVFSEVLWGQTSTDEKEIENKWLTHNIVDQVLAFVDWPENYMIVYITDIIQNPQLSQSFGMLELETTDYYHVYLNMQAAFLDKYTFIINATNPYQNVQINQFDLTVVANIDVKENYPLELQVDGNSVVYIDLNQYYSFQNLAAVLKGQWYDEKGRQVDKSIPEVQSCYKLTKTEILRGDVQDLLWQNNQLYILYKHQVTKKINLAIWNKIAFSISNDIETGLYENTRFGQTIKNTVLQEYIVTASDDDQMTKINIFKSSSLSQTFEQTLPYKKLDFWITSGFNDELYFIMTSEKSNKMVAYVKKNIADNEPFKFAWEYDTQYPLIYVSSDFWMNTFVTCTNQTVDFYQLQSNGQLVRTYQQSQSSLGQFSSCYYSEESTILTGTTEKGGYEFYVQNEKLIKNTNKYYPAYKEVFDKEFKSLYMDSQTNLLQTSNPEISSYHIVQYKRENDFYAKSEQPVVVETSIPLSEPLKCVAQTKSSTYNVKNIFCLEKESTHQIKIFEIYENPLVIISPESSYVKFNGSITFYQTYNPWRNITFDNVVGDQLDVNKYALSFDIEQKENSQVSLNVLIVIVSLTTIMLALACYIRRKMKSQKQSQASESQDNLLIDSMRIKTEDIGQKSDLHSLTFQSFENINQSKLIQQGQLLDSSVLISIQEQEKIDSRSSERQVNRQGMQQEITLQSKQAVGRLYSDKNLPQIRGAKSEDF